MDIVYFYHRYNKLLSGRTMMTIVKLGNELETHISEIASKAAVSFIETKKFREEYFSEDKHINCYRNKVHDAIKDQLTAGLLKWSYGYTGQTGWIYNSEKKEFETTSSGSEVTFRNVIPVPSKNRSHLETSLGGTDIVISHVTHEVDESQRVRNAFNLMNNNKTTEEQLKDEIIGIETKVLHYKKSVSGLQVDETQYFVTGNPGKVPNSPQHDFYKNGIMTTNLEGQVLSDIARGCFILNHQSAVTKFFIFGVIVFNIKEDSSITKFKVCTRMQSLISGLFSNAVANCSSSDPCSFNITPNPHMSGQPGGNQLNFRHLCYKGKKYYIPENYQFMGNANVIICDGIPQPETNPATITFPYSIMLTRSCVSTKHMGTVESNIEQPAEQHGNQQQNSNASSSKSPRYAKQL